MKKIFLIGCFFLSSFILVGCGSQNSDGTDSNDRSVLQGDTIKVDYTGRLEDGTVFDTSNEEIAKENELYNPMRPYEPLEFTVGAGMMIPGFDSGVVGMNVGEKKTLTISPADGYGEISDSTVDVVPAEVFEQIGVDPVEGETYNFGAINGTVKSIGSGGIEVIVNHFLAGKTLLFDVELSEIVVEQLPEGSVATGVLEE